MRPKPIFLVTVTLALATAVGVATGASTHGPASPIAACAFGTNAVALASSFDATIDQSAARYAATLGADSMAERRRAEEVFSAAAAAYAYGMPQEILLKTIHGYVRNEIININALATPSTQGVVSPNVDTAYSVAWIDLTDGPVVVNVPDTGRHFYTFQFMDAYTNAFAYVGSGSTGTQAAAYAIVPPGWKGSLPAGVHKIQSPTNSVWLLGRTLVDGSSDFPAVKKIQEQYKLTPLAMWETGLRDPSVTIGAYPAGKTKTLPTGTAFISTLNQELMINPPPADDACALKAMAPAAVVFSHPTAAQTEAADAANIAGVTPPSTDDSATAAAVQAGVTAAVAAVTPAFARLDAAASKGTHGWAILTHMIGTYGRQYIARVIVATNYLGANTPAQGMYPVVYVDVDGRPFNGARDYTVTFPKGLLPPARAFWSLTMYNSGNYLYANQLGRYAIGDRTTGLVYDRDGSLTLHIGHSDPESAAARANWLPAPSGIFHMILRLYQPSKAALEEKWKPPPVFRTGETLRPVLSRLRVTGHRLAYRDSQSATTRITITSRSTRRIIASISHHDRAGLDRVSLAGLGLPAGRYEVRARATGARSSYDNARSRTVTLGFAAD